MTTYTVHHRSDTAAGILERSEETEFVKDGFCWPALLVPALWLLARRQWIAFFVYLGFVILLGLIGEALSLSDYVVTVLSLGANLLLGFEANDLRRWTLRRRGYRDAGLVIASKRDDAERRFFQAMIEAEDDVVPSPPSQPERPMPEQKPIQVARAFKESSEPVGLFPAPGAQT